jgi:hypothetical protein
MGDREVPDELSMERVEKESGVALEERVFTVGEVVEYWEGAFVRGERLGSGEPAFVKRLDREGSVRNKNGGSIKGKVQNPNPNPNPSSCIATDTHAPLIARALVSMHG